MAIALKKFIARFVEEARSNIQTFEQELSELNTKPDDQELINGLFRAIHTIKGSSRMLKLENITQGAHKLEDVLDALRSGQIRYSQQLEPTILSASDMLTAQIDAVDKSGEAPAPDASVIKALEDIVKGDTERDTDGASQHTQEQNQGEDVTPPPEEQEAKLKTSDMVRVQRTKLDELIKLMGELVSSHGRLQQRLKEIKSYDRLHGQDTKDDDSTIHTFSKNLNNDVFDQQLLMEELHNKVLVMRMLPLSIVFEPAVRLVREVGRSLDKKVTCKVKGAELELDRQLIDKLSDPMVHLIRNAVDHGLESVEQRKAAGKPEIGEIEISAQQDGSWALIEIKDDGAGIAMDTIKRKVLEKRLRTEEELEAMTNKQIMNLIFLPGFSTSTMITDISGRGVGLDVVRRNIMDEMHGRIDMHSTLGEGTTFQLRLPFSLALMKVLLVDVVGQHFGFTAQNIYSLIEVAKDKIQLIAERKMITFHNEFVPLFDLAQLLGIERAEKSVKASQQLIVVQVQNEKVALAIDDLVDELDMVIKPLPEHLQGIPLITGMVMTGSNELISILHIPTLVEMAAKQVSDRQAKSISVNDIETQEVKAQHILVVDDSLNTREIEKSILEAHGYQVTLAEDGQDGFNKAQKRSFDAVLTDVEMPIMDGFTLTKSLREVKQYTYVPIIIITSRAKEDDRRRGMEAGADAYIVKGDFEQNNLIETLQVLLG